MPINKSFISNNLSLIRWNMTYFIKSNRLYIITFGKNWSPILVSGKRLNRQHSKCIDNRFFIREVFTILSESFSILNESGVRMPWSPGAIPLYPQYIHAARRQKQQNRWPQQQAFATDLVHWNLNTFRQYPRTRFKAGISSLHTSPWWRSTARRRSSWEHPPVADPAVLQLFDGRPQGDEDSTEPGDEADRVRQRGVDTQDRRPTARTNAGTIGRKHRRDEGRQTGQQGRHQDFHLWPRLLTPQCHYTKYPSRQLTLTMWLNRWPQTWYFI